jgi:glycosyltransferase involved in cell wall biosynthesis
VLAQEIARGVVHVAGDVAHESLPAWYRTMDLFVMPSRYENYSNAILEALACGVPFVASAVGGNRVLSDTGAGWVVAHDPAGNLAACLDEALADRARLQARGACGRAHVDGRYSWMATAERLEDIFSRLQEHQRVDQRAGAR